MATLVTVLTLAGSAVAQQAEQENPGAAAWRRGMSLLGKGLTDAAIAQFTTLIKYDPNDPVSYCYRADAHARKKDWPMVLADADSAIRLDPKLTWAYVLRGQACTGLRNHRDAMIALSQAIRMDPQFVNAFVQRGYLYAQMGDADKANRDFTMANRLLVEQAGGQPSEVR
jgi:tetratricopeptide (TPR) repeat protein